MRPFTTLRGYIAGSIKRQLVLGVVAIHTVLMVLFAVHSVSNQAAALNEGRLHRAEGMAQMLAASAVPWVLSEDTVGLTELIGSAAAFDGLRYAMVLTPSGQVLGHTDRRHIGGRISDETGQSLIGSAARTQQLNYTANTLDVAAPIIADGHHKGWVWVSLSRADVNAAIAKDVWTALLYSIAAILSGALVAWFMARYIGSGLRRLADVSERFRAGERLVRFTDSRRDEVGRAGRGLNDMLEAIATSEQSLKHAQHLAKIGTWRCAAGAERLFWSEEAFAMFGLDPSGPPPTLGEFMGYLSEDSRAAVAAILQAPQMHPSLSLVLTFIRGDGSKGACWAEGEVRVDGTGALLEMGGICQDITEREAAAAQLHQAQKMEMVGQLTGGLAHDFNNLLAIIIGNLDLLEEQYRDGQDRELVDEALTAALRGSELTQQLLAFSRRQPLAPKSIDLNELISGISSLCRRTVGEAIEVRINLAGDLWLTRADQSQVESAIVNLVVNARDAMPAGGVLTLETSNIHYGIDGGIGADGIAPGYYSMVTVSDTGEGMAPEIVARAFEPFFTTKAVGKGSGLGLSMVYGFAKQSGGHVKIYSELGHGTAVCLFLPRANESTLAVQPDEDPAEPAPAAGEKVLLVEDNEGVRRITARLMEELGYLVLTAENGPEALDILNREPQVDLLFTDIIMPAGMNGFELSASALRIHPSLKVLHTSGFTKLAAENLPLGAASNHVLLTKPYRKSELATVLRQVLDEPVARTASG